VRNTGNVGLSGVVVRDDQAGVVPVYASGDVDGNGILDVGETWTYVASGTARSGNYSNIGTVNGNFTDSLGQKSAVSAQDPSSYTGIASGVLVLLCTGGLIIPTPHSTLQSHIIYHLAPTHSVQEVTHPIFMCTSQLISNTCRHSAI
jgi:hypothetical protein